MGANLMVEIVPGYTDVKEDLTFNPHGSKYQMNLGMEYSFWKDYINAIVELNRCKYIFRWLSLQNPFKNNKKALIHRNFQIEFVSLRSETIKSSLLCHPAL